MFYKFGFDLNYNENNSEKPLSLENCFAIAQIDVYHKLMKALSIPKPETKKYFKNNDCIYFSTDTRVLFAEYKIEEYCLRNKIIVKTVPKLKDANVLISDIANALSVITHSNNRKIYTYPLKKLIKFINTESLGDVDVENDLVLLPKGIQKHDKLSKYFDFNFIEESEVCFYYSFSKDETRKMLDEFEPFASLYEAVINNKTIISHEYLSVELHKESTIIDAEMYKSLLQMIKSPDEENKTLAINMIADANREESLPYLILLYTENIKMYDNINEKNVNEFVTFICSILNNNVDPKSVKKYLTKELNFDYKNL